MVTQTVGIAVESEHDRAVLQPVEHGGGDGGVTEDLAPFGHRPVGGDHDARFQISLRHNLKQRRGGFGGQRKIPQLVNCQQSWSSEEPHAGGPAALDGGFVAAGG